MSIVSVGERTVKRRKVSHNTSQRSHNPQSNGHVGDIEHHSVGGKNQTMASQKSKGETRSSTTTMNVKESEPTGGMTRSSMMALQTTDLLAQLSCNCSAKLRSFQSSVDHVIQSIKGLPERPAAPLQLAEKILKKDGFAVPFVSNRPRSDIKYHFIFAQSQSISLRGVLATGIATKECNSVEIAVEMPSSIFQEKDFLNHRAFHKRAFYLACIAAGLAKNLKGYYRVQYALGHGNPLYPIIQLTPESASEKKQPTLTVNVLFGLDLGSRAKTLPSKNCVRESAASDIADVQHPPTPFYNSSLRWLSATSQLDELIKKSLGACESFKDACSLGQIWLQQRGYASSVSNGGLGVEEWALMTALLLISGGYQGRPLFSDRYTSLQLFRAILQVFSNRDLINDPLIIRGETSSLSNLEVPIFFDVTTGVNVLYKMTTWSYSRLRHMAQLSLASMNSRKQNCFDAIFIMDSSSFLLQFDETYSFNVPSQAIEANDSEERFSERLYSALKRGLGDRVQLIDIRSAEVSSWIPSGSFPPKNQRTILVGLLVNSNAANRTLDHGPSAEEQDEARDFREFWGEKSELRRFRDGRITETLVWSESIPVTHQIIQYLSFSHFGIPPSSITKISPHRRMASVTKASPITATDAFKLINTKYQELASQLHQLDGLPLPIRSVSPSDECLRSATMVNPLSYGSAQPINVLIQFDSSTRWPDHLPAIQFTKVAFLTKLGDLLTNTGSTYSTRIGVENTESSNTGYFNTSFLDVIQPAPAPGMTALVFRLRIHHDRELQLLQASSSKESSTSTRETLTSAIAAFKREFLASPTHTATLRNLITHFTPLSDTIRLLRMWMASHHLTNHFPEPVLEVIAAHVFLHPTPWSVPGTSETGFLRCLHFLSHWDWANNPLIVDLSLTQAMTASAYTELETRFQAWRKLDPAMSNVTWFIGTNIDHTGTVWTQGSRPSRVVATRARALAKASIELIEAQDAAMKAEDWESLFHSGITEFDFVIHLKSSIIKRNSTSEASNGTTKYKNLIVHEELDTDKIGHDVVQLYLGDLERTFASSILFFHGHGDTVIAGLWRPTTAGEKEWRVRLGYSSVPLAQDNETVKCTVNKEAIIAEMANLGQGMIERIEVKN